MKKVLFVSFFLSTIFVVESFHHNDVQSETTKYSVFCASGKIEIDMRTLEQMKSARGSSVCQFAEFTTLSSAQDFASKNFHGEGASCSCGN